MMDLPITVILLPLIAGAIVMFVPESLRRVHEAIALAVSAATLILTGLLFIDVPCIWPLGAANTLLLADRLAGFVALFIAVFGAAVIFYSVAFMKGAKSLNQYYGYILLTIGGAIGAALSNNLILLLCFWGFLGCTLYMLISMGGPDSAQAAKKTFIIIGGSDAIMLLGVAIIWYLTGRLEMNSIRLNLSAGPYVTLAFICFIIGAFAKAGVMPLHTWIPDSSEFAPAPVAALLPASLDKLLGIYLLARLTLNMFIVTPGSGVSAFLLMIGALTIIAGVMMALVQHNFKRLLAYHAVSQVGYMVLGIGTANPIGIAGGLFHMLNNAVYKSCLFLSGGSVEKATGTMDMNKLGGLMRFMPITFTACLVASLSISGVPPFNGFFSKWMIYQGLIEMGKSGGKLWIPLLVIAMFASALTLASFMKLIYSTFLSPRNTKYDIRTTIRESSAFMWLPQIALAALCIIFGVFAYRIPIRLFMKPSVSKVGQLHYPGVWDAPLATALILIGIIIGAVLFIAGRAASIKRSDIFIGGELLEDNSGIKAGAFYDTIKDMPLLGAMYKSIEKKFFDIYEVGTNIVFFFTNILRWLHNGILPTYMTWCLIGMLVVFFTLMR